jgi:hypothetical protein
LTIPVVEQAKPRKIEVETGGQPAQLAQPRQTIQGEVAQGEATPSGSTGSGGSTG